MSNYLKNLTVTFTPTVQGGWDDTAKTKTLSNPDGSTPIPSSNAIDDAFGLWPETTYTVAGTASDAYNQAITVTVSAASTATASYETKRDFPAFSRISAGHAIYTMTGANTGEELNIFNNRNNKTYGMNQPEDLMTSISSGDIISTGARAQLNAGLLNASSFKVEFLSDYSDPNVYNLSEPTDWQQLSGVTAIASSRYIGYYDFNSFIPNFDAAIEFDAYNKKLGTYSISADLYKGASGTNLSIIPETLSPTITKSDASANMPCASNINAFFEAIDEGGVDEGKDLMIPKPSTFSMTYPVGKVYKAKVDDPSASTIDDTDLVDGPVNVLGICTDEWKNNEKDTIWTLDIKATTPHRVGSSYNTSTESDIRIDLWTLFPPRQVLKQVEIVSGVGQRLNEVQFTSQNWYAQSPSRTSICFVGKDQIPTQGDSEVGYFNFSTETDSRRPFLPLVHKNLDKQENIFGLISGFNTSDDGNGREEYFMIDDPIGQHPDDADICTFGTTFVVEGLLDHLTLGQAQTILNSPWDSGIRWKALTMYNTEDSLGGSGYVDEDFYNDVMDSKTQMNSVISSVRFPADDMESFTKYLSTGIGSDRNFQQTIYTTGWPYRDTTINELTPNAVDNFYQNLIPGKYYAFRVTSANYAGISSKPFIIKTTDPTPMSFTTEVNNVSGTNSTSGTHSIGSINISTGSTLSILANFSTGYGRNIYNNTVITVVDNEPSHTAYGTGTATTWSGNSPVFASSGTYTLTITSPYTQLQNDNVSIAPIVHTYTINVTDADSITVNTGNSSNITINSADLDGSASATGNASFTTRGFFYSNTESDITAIAGQTHSTQPSVTYTNDSASTQSTSANINATASNLTSSTQYWYCAYVYDNNGNYVCGSKATFTTDSPINPLNIDFGQITRTTGTITVS